MVILIGSSLAQFGLFIFTFDNGKVKNKVIDRAEEDDYNGFAYALGFSHEISNFIDIDFSAMSLYQLIIELNIKLDSIEVKRQKFCFLSAVQFQVVTSNF